jgi:hypothetical protein
LEHYQVGDLIAVETTFRNEDGTLTTPTTRVANVIKPDGTETAIVPTVESTGVLRATLPTFDTPGIWRWYIAGTAGLIAADQGSVFVEAAYT